MPLIISGRLNRKKAVAVAKDVLKQIQKEIYVPAEGDFVNENDIGWNDFVDKCMVSGHKELSEHLKENPPEECYVCMLGAVWLSAVQLFNDFTLYYSQGSTDSLHIDMQDEDDPAKSPGAMLAHIFGSDYPYMEASFEVGHGWFDEGNTSRLREKTIIKSLFLAAVKFGERYKEPLDRMKAICRNIIRNEGRFMP